MADDRPAPPVYRVVPAPPGPGFEAVEVWAADLSAITESVDECAAVLPEDEQAQARALRFDLHRERFIRRRWLRRRILADRFGFDARNLRFETDRLGWPRLVAPDRLVGLGFSSSHADGRALVAVRTGGQVGVDIARSDLSMQEAEAREFMSPPELAQWSALRGAVAADFLFRLWTRKEACLKASGTGLARDPRTVDARDPRATAPAAPRAGWPAASWRTADLALGPGWAGAAAIPTGL